MSVNNISTFVCPRLSHTCERVEAVWQTTQVLTNHRNTVRWSWSPCLTRSHVVVVVNFPTWTATTSLVPLEWNGVVRARKYNVARISSHCILLLLISTVILHVTPYLWPVLILPVVSLCIPSRIVFLVGEETVSNEWREVPCTICILWRRLQIVNTCSIQSGCQSSVGIPPFFTLIFIIFRDTCLSSIKCLVQRLLAWIVGSGSQNIHSLNGSIQSNQVVLGTLCLIQESKQYFLCSFTFFFVHISRRTIFHIKKHQLIVKLAIQETRILVSQIFQLNKEFIHFFLQSHQFSSFACLAYIEEFEVGCHERVCFSCSSLCDTNLHITILCQEESNGVVFHTILIIWLILAFSKPLKRTRNRSWSPTFFTIVTISHIPTTLVASFFHVIDF